MYSPFAIAQKYLHYLITSLNGKGHGIHSPFIYDLVRNVLMDKTVHPAYAEAEKYRAACLRDHRVIEVQDLGAGTTGKAGNKRRVSDILKTSVKPRKYGRLICRLAEYYGHRQVLELGTSLGVTSTYLARVTALEKLVTIEGVPAIADAAEVHFQQADLQKIRLIRGDFNVVLEDTLKTLGRVDMAFVDGNHRKEPTLQYFEKILRYAVDHTVIIFDDIHWSREMEEAWQIIQHHERVRCSVDLFFMGIVFLHPDFRERQSFIIRY